MSFKSFEESVQLADPVYLFLIAIGATNYRYTSSVRDVVADGKTWQAAPIRADAIKLTDKMALDEFALFMPFDHELPQKLMSYLVQSASITVFSFYRSDGEIMTEFIGADATVSPEDRKNCKIVFSSIFRLAQKDGLSPRFSKRCRHAIYSTGCQLEPNSNKQTVTIDSISGKNIIVAESLSTGEFIGGMLKTSLGTYHYIYNQTGKTLTMFDVVPFIHETEVVDIFKGCDQSMKRCRELSNAPNFGGDLWLGVNIFDGRLIR